MTPLVIPLVQIVMPMVPLALLVVTLVPLVSTIGLLMVPLATIGKITNGTIGRTPNRAYALKKINDGQVGLENEITSS